MREPFETLLGQYRDHWMLWSFLEDDTPDFVRLAATDCLGALSSGEIVMLNVALAFWNGDRTARMSDLAILDDDNRRRVAEAIYIGMGVRRGG